MPMSNALYKSMINTVIDSEVMDRLEPKLKPKSVKEKPLIRNFGKAKADFDLQYVSGSQNVVAEDHFQGNIENFIGVAQIPIGVAGPLRVNGAYAQGDFFVPLATTEGALVASYNRGARAMSMSGGATAMCVSDCISRAPGFVFRNISESSRFVAWCSENFEIFKDIVQQVTRFGRLQDIQPTLENNYVFINFQFTTGDAAGQNMVTIATDAICQCIVNFSPVKPQRWYIEGNLSGDKKATRLSHQTGRGKKVLAEVVIPNAIVQKMLKTTPQKIVDYSAMATQGGIQSGSIGTHGHFANALSAMYIACGQDAACVSESAIGTSRAEVTEDGDLYACVSLPNLVVGTVGGGTHLPTQRECLDMLGCLGKGKSRKFAEICAATVLAGEISIAAALSAGHFTAAHINYARKPKTDTDESRDYCCHI